jgi:hypothetical protein
MSFWASQAALEASEQAHYQLQVGQIASTSPPRRRVFEVSVYD